MRASSLLTTLLFFFLVPGEVSYVNVSNITTFGFTITWGRPAYENGDLRNYSVILFNANGTIKERMDVNISTEKVSFYKLNPGWCHVNIYLISNTNHECQFDYRFSSLPFLNISQVYVTV